MNKKFLIILATNIIILFFLLIFIDMCFVYYKNNSYIIKNGFRLLPHTAAKYSELARDNISGPAIPNENQKEDKRPIVFSGCSIAHGLYLPFEETIGYLITQQTGRKSYNRGISATNISHLLYELTQTDIYDKMGNPEYIFFIYDPAVHHLRINTYIYNPTSQIEYLHYKLKNGKIINVTGQTIPFISSLSFYRKFMFDLNLKKSFNKYNADLMAGVFKEVNKTIQKKFPDTKFIVIIYEGNYPDNKYTINYYNGIIYKLINSGIEIVSVNKMLGDDSSLPKYKTDLTHPSNIVWNKISNKLIEKYNL